MTENGIKWKWGGGQKPVNTLLEGFTIEKIIEYFQNLICQLTGMKSQTVIKLLNMETVSYTFWGVATSIFNLGFYWILLFGGIEYKISNFISLIFTKLLAFAVNKVFVFKTKNDTILDFIGEFSRFIVSRGFTMILDMMGLILLVDYFHFDKVLCKGFIMVVVIIVNYFLGKKFVFSKKDHN